MKIINKLNPNTYLVERLWPYIQFEDHREYLTENEHLSLEGLYLDFAERRWMPQNETYKKESELCTEEFRQVLEFIERI